MVRKSFTLREFIDAIEKNGLPQAYGGLFRVDGDYIDVDTEVARETISKNTIESACALGQGYINVGVWPFDDEEGGYLADILPNDIVTYVVSLNDSLHEPLDLIADNMRAYFAERLDEVYSGIEVNYNVKAQE